MKIAFVIFKYFPYGGSQRDFYRIATECIKRGHHVDIYTTAWEGELIEGVSTTIVPIGGWTSHAKTFLFAKKIEKILDESKYDVVVGFNKIPHLDIYFAADICWKTKLDREKKCLYRLLGRYRKYLQLEKNVFDFFRSSTKIMVLTNQQRDEYQECYQTQDERFYLLPPGIEKNNLSRDEMTKVREQLRKKLEIASHEILLLFVANDFHNKGLDRAIQALKNLQNPKVRLLVIGGDCQAPYLRLVRHYQLDKQVIFLGARQGLLEYMLASDLLIHPSRIDSAGMVLLEALTAELPVLTTESCGYAFHIRLAKAGKVVSSPFQLSVLVEALRSMLDESERKIWRRNALIYAKTADLYSLPQRAADFIEQ